MLQKDVELTVGKNEVLQKEVELTVGKDEMLQKEVELTQQCLMVNPKECKTNPDYKKLLVFVQMACIFCSVDLYHVARSEFEPFFSQIQMRSLI